MKIVNADMVKDIARETPAFQFYEGDVRDVEALIEDVPEISDEEFKAEAKRRGYNLIKIPENVKLLPCICGEKQPQSWYCKGLTFYKCGNCGVASPMSKGERKAKLNWNKMIEENMKDATD